MTLRTKIRDFVRDGGHPEGVESPKIEVTDGGGNLVDSPLSAMRHVQAIRCFFQNAVSVAGKAP